MVADAGRTARRTTFTRRERGRAQQRRRRRFVAPAFAETYRTVLFDHVGAGHSDVAAYDFTKYASLDGYVDGPTRTSAPNRAGARTAASTPARPCDGGGQVTARTARDR